MLYFYIGGNGVKAWLKEFYPQHLTLCLGLFGLANLWAMLFGMMSKVFVAYIVVTIMVLSAVRLLMYPEIRKKEWQAVPALAAYSAGTCAGYFLAQTVGFYFPMVGQLLWGLFVLMHLVLLGRFTMLQLKGGWQWTSLHPLWFLFFLAFGVAAIVGPSLGLKALSQGLAIFALASYGILMPLVVYRIYAKQPLPTPMVSSKMLLEAAPSMVLISLLSSFEQVPMSLALLLLVLGQGFFVFLLWSMDEFIQLPFGPGHTAFTFPLAIGALALYRFESHYLDLGSPAALLCWGLFLLEAILASLVILSVFIGIVWKDVSKTRQ